MKMKVGIVCVSCRVNDNGNPVGHEEKAIKQAAMLLEGNIEIIVGKEYEKCVENCLIKADMFCIKDSDSILMKNVKLIINTYLAVHQNKSGIIWFVYINEVILWILLLLPKRNKYMMTTYIDWNQKFSQHQKLARIREKLFKRSLNRIDYVIATDSHYKIPNKSINIPDFYLESEYKKYIFLNKAGVVCVGVMSRKKGVLEIARAFNIANESITISGYFEDEKYFNEVKQFETDKIIINNVLLNYDEYIKLIGSAKYVIIPYGIESHNYKTSGILQETVALNSIPVAFPQFLKYNNVEGISFEKYEDIPKVIREYEVDSKLVNNDWGKYDFDYIKETLKRAIPDLFI